MRVNFGERQAGDVQPATVIEVEHVRLVDHGLVVEPGAAFITGDRDTAEDALLHGQHELVRDAFLPGDPADQLADAEPEVADRAGRELQERAARDDLPDVERQGRLRPDGPALCPRVVRRVPRDVRLPLVRIHVHVVDEGARHFHVAHPQAAACGELPNLRDDDAAAVPGRHGHGQHLALDGLALHRQVAVLVRGRAAYDGHVDRERVVEEPLTTPDRDDLHEVLGRPGILPAAGMARIDVRAEPDLGEHAWPSRGDLAHELGQDALRKGVRLDLVRFHQRPEPGFIADVAADRAAHEPGEAELREPAIREVADTHDADRRQVTGPALRCVDRGELVDEALRQRVTGTRAADHDREAVADEPDRLPDVEDLAHGM